MKRSIIVVFLILCLFGKLYAETSDSDNRDDLEQRVEELEKRVEELEIEVEENTRNVAINQDDLDIYPGIDWGNTPQLDIGIGMLGPYKTFNLGYKMKKWGNSVSLGLTFSLLYLNDEVYLEEDDYTQQYISMIPHIGPSMTISSPLLFNLTRLYGGFDAQVGYQFFLDPNFTEGPDSKSYGPRRLTLNLFIFAGIEFYANKTFSFFIETGYGKLFADPIGNGTWSAYLDNTPNTGLGIRMGFRYYLSEK